MQRIADMYTKTFQTNKCVISVLAVAIKAIVHVVRDRDTTLVKLGYMNCAMTQKYCICDVCEKLKNKY